jgi:nitroreductase
VTFTSAGKEVSAMASGTSARQLSDDDLAWAIEHAVRAPSVDNTQPWRFGWDGETISLYADLRRGLVASDPQGRELVISCGAVLYTLRLALRQLGLSVTVARVPEEDDDRLLATVTVGPGEPPSEDEQALFKAVPRRHTRRGSFSSLTIDADLAVRLQQAAWGQGARLLFVHDPGPQRQILQLALTASQIRRDDPETRAETERWTPPPDSQRRDGVPARAYRPTAVVDGNELASRDFDLDRNQGLVEPTALPVGGIAALVTDGDTLRDWLTAGEALQAVLLTAARDWSFAVLHSRATEIPGIRADLRRALGTSGHPHMLLRFGYARDAPATPRRAASEVIELTT